MALYDGEIAENDASFGRLLDDLRARGLLQRSAVLFTSDHGEEFHEHGGWRHAESLFEEVLRVPLVVRLPGGAPAGATVADPADQIDIAPTLLDLAGVAAPPELPGASLLPVIGGGRRRRASRSPGSDTRRSTSRRSATATGSGCGTKARGAR